MMRQKNIVEGVGVFVVVAEAGSFSEAAKRLGVSPSAVSQAIRSLEARLGAPLLRRSTRSVSLTDIGADYLDMAAPALSQLRRAADEVAGRGGQLGGALRITMSRAPFDLLIAEALVAFQEKYPQIDLEIAVEAHMVDIVQQGFDAGLRYGSFVEKDMVAILVAPRSEAILVASPTYLRTRSPPAMPDDLLKHRALMCRSQINGMIKPWILQSGAESVQIAPSSATVVHDLASQIDLAKRGLGIVSAPLASVAAHLSAGQLVRILPGWSTPLDELYLYFPNRRHQSAALRAFITFLRKHTSESTQASKDLVQSPFRQNIDIQ